ncbi:hypothetical protein C2W64_00639 [Brevibacillus laterosporus]|nr:hypothetical protein C2W64_00639 [Brevibacillus laterosporus]
MKIEQLYVTDTPLLSVKRNLATITGVFFNRTRLQYLENGRNRVKGLLPYTWQQDNTLYLV